MALALFHPPEFLAGFWLVRIESFRAETDQRVLAIDLRDARRREGFSIIAIRFRLAVLQIFKINRTISLPNCLACLFIEGDDILVIAAVEIHDQQVLVENWRRTSAAKMIADE